MNMGTTSASSGGSIIPSANAIRTLMLLSDPGTSSSALDWETTGLAVPQTVFPDFSQNAAATSLAELSSRGEFAPPVIKSNSVQYAEVTSSLGGDAVHLRVPQDSRQIFSRRDKKATVYVNWQSSFKEKIVCAVRLFNAENKLMSDSKSREVSLASGKYSSTSWDVPVGVLSPGIYRVDLLVNDKTVWREFFRVTE